MTLICWLPLHSVDLVLDAVAVADVVVAAAVAAMPPPQLPQRTRCADRCNRY